MLAGRVWSVLRCHVRSLYGHRHVRSRLARPAGQPRRCLQVQRHCVQALRVVQVGLWPEQHACLGHASRKFLLRLLSLLPSLLCRRVYVSQRALYLIP